MSHSPADHDAAALDRKDARPTECFADNFDFDTRDESQRCKTPLQSAPCMHTYQSHPVSG